jgi:hypothetical protein
MLCAPARARTVAGTAATRCRAATDRSELKRISESADTAIRLLRVIGDIDITDLLILSHEPAWPRFIDEICGFLSEQ